MEDFKNETNKEKTNNSVAKKEATINSLSTKDKNKWTDLHYKQINIEKNNDSDSWEFLRNFPKEEVIKILKKEIELNSFLNNLEIENQNLNNQYNIAFYKKHFFISKDILDYFKNNHNINFTEKNQSDLKIYFNYESQEEIKNSITKLEKTIEETNNKLKEIIPSNNLKENLDKIIENQRNIYFLESLKSKYEKIKTEKISSLFNSMHTSNIDDDTITSLDNLGFNLKNETHKTFIREFVIFKKYFFDKNKNSEMFLEDVFKNNGWINEFINKIKKENENKKNIVNQNLENSKNINLNNLNLKKTLKETIWNLIVDIFISDKLKQFTKNQEYLISTNEKVIKLTKDNILKNQERFEKARLVDRMYKWSLENSFTINATKSLVILSLIIFTSYKTYNYIKGKSDEKEISNNLDNNITNNKRKEEEEEEIKNKQEAYKKNIENIDKYLNDLYVQGGNYKIKISEDYFFYTNTAEKAQLIKKILEIRSISNIEEQKSEWDKLNIEKELENLRNKDNYTQNQTSKTENIAPSTPTPTQKTESENSVENINEKIENIDKYLNSLCVEGGKWKLKNNKGELVFSTNTEEKAQLISDIYDIKNQEDLNSQIKLWKEKNITERYKDLKDN